MAAQILVDGWPEDVIETTAWVEWTQAICTGILAVRHLEQKFPPSDREEGETYACYGEFACFRPMGDPLPDGRYRVFRPHVMTDPDLDIERKYQDYDPAEGPWEEADGRGVAGVKKFWVIRVVCPT